MKSFTIRSLVILLLILIIPPPLLVFSLDFIVPDTGQELCYDWTAIIDCPREGEDFYGQDGNYSINPPDLTDNGDGTVTDNLTGLTWEQKTGAGEALSYTYSDAVTYCDTLTLGEYTDWRVPTRSEFSTLLNYGRVSPALDITFFPHYSYTNPYETYYWTTSEYHDDPSLVWKMQLSFGLIEKDSKSSDPPVFSKVRCVRGPHLPSAVFRDNGNGTVTDTVTGLMWEQKTDDGGNRDKDTTYTWKDALAYCENLLLGEFSDWRLPTPKEFERIVALDRSNPAIDTTYFPYTNSSLYWTGTTCSGCHKMKAFAVDFSDGELYYGNKYRNQVYYENYVRCVRTADVSGTSTTTTVFVSSTTTTSIIPQPCPIETLYGSKSEEARLLRQLRDTVLKETPEGNALIRIYYEFAPAITQALEKDASFKKELKIFLDECILLIDTR